MSAESSSTKIPTAHQVHAAEYGSAQHRAKYLAVVQAAHPRSLDKGTTTLVVAEAFEVPPLDAGAILYSSETFKAYPRGADAIGKFATLAEAQASLRAWGKAGETVVAFCAWLATLLPSVRGSAPSLEVGRSGVRKCPGESEAQRRSGR